MAALIALALVLAALAWSLAPVLLQREAPAADSCPREALEAERTRLVAALRDLDLDLAMGKVAAADHAALRRSLEAEAVAVLARLEALGPATTAAQVADAGAPRSADGDAAR